jgi:hypothetical protein
MKRSSYKLLNQIDYLFCIFDYLTYQELCQLRLVSRTWKQLVKQFEHQKSQQYINSLPRCENIEKKILSALKESKLQLFDTKTLKVHHYNLVIDHGYMKAFFGPAQQIFITIHFTYFHKKRFHQVKVYELFSDDLSADGELDWNQVQYGIPGFQLSFTATRKKQFPFGDDDGDEQDLSYKKLPQWMGFKGGKRFEKMFFILWSTCTAII